ncbi:Piso0_001900 [Millerozyma farinosa CBS 7064]|uniref:Piso0_001900 protein n=1 Tax=Pichia sorbitophila (strain ATCC MYA-4447 / BCRC 22081 / CBS 7064 / NBRC 10061 / NRRL Y-12695) TaxID=559304 RepID=G8YB56_PICSO|nr:Piso0_001900 [Millerozyma farinosa CBS 7064]
MTSIFEDLATSSGRALQFYKDDGNKCELIGTFSLMTQVVLGLLCLSSLIVKRFYEYPIRRTWNVWLFDVSKQILGALGLHIFNVCLSILKTSDMNLLKNFNATDDSSDIDEDPCDWYFLNIVFDCTIGVFIFYLVFKYMNSICKNQFHMTNIESGQYGESTGKPSFKAFLKQTAVYFFSLMLTKLFIYAIMECFETQLLWISSHVLLVWLTPYPDEIEIFVVMFIVPIIMNCLQLILVDNIIQNPLINQMNTLVYTEGQSRILNNSSTTDGAVGKLIDGERAASNIQTGNKSNGTKYGSCEDDT